MTDENETAVQKLWPDGEGPLRRETVETSDSALIVDVGGFEGPLDLLLELARHHKVDLARISILALAEQYLAYIDNARKMRIEVAADYLVMAAWLAYLKSRLMLPEPPQSEDQPTAEQMADALAWQLRRLEAMQEAGIRLMARGQLGRDWFRRGAPEGVPIVRKPIWDVKLYDLLKNYGEIHRRGQDTVMHIKPMEFYSVEEAAERLGRMLGIAVEWQSLLSFLPPGLQDAMKRRSAMAATFVASLHMAKEGQLELRQTEAFGPIFMRKRPASE
jgi:segregation and condensation protein A